MGAFAKLFTGGGPRWECFCCVRHTLINVDTRKPVRLRANHEPGRKVTTKKIGDIYATQDRKREREKEKGKERTNDEHFQRRIVRS